MALRGEKAIGIGPVLVSVRLQSTMGLAECSNAPNDAQNAAQL